MKKLLSNYWVKLLAAPVFTILSLGVLVLPDKSFGLSVCFLVWLFVGLLIWLLAVKKYLERDVQI